jgi:aryl-alcohol dehydrogenase-like predicted oxidoreductase
MTGLRVSAVGLGCSRLGSALANCSGQAAIRLVEHAVDRGIVLFDTADIYGQGDSERLLGQALRNKRNDVVLVSKAGQHFTTAQRIGTLAKAPVRHLSRRFPALGDLVAARRAQPLPRDYTPGHIRRALEGSLRRLKSDWIDLFLLHSPTVDDLREGRCFELIERIRQQGLISAWGISCDDLPTAAAALRVPGVTALQLPLAVAQSADASPFVAAVAEQRLGLLVREIFTPLSKEGPLSTWRRSRLASALTLPNAAALVGTTKPDHLDEALADLPGTVPMQAPLKEFPE